MIDARGDLAGAAGERFIGAEIDVPAARRRGQGEGRRRQAVQVRQHLPVGQARLAVLRVRIDDEKAAARGNGDAAAGS